MDDHLKRASKALGISVKRLKDPNGLTAAEEAAYEDWRLQDYYARYRRVPLAAVSEGTGIPIGRLRDPEQLTPKQRWRAQMFLFWYLASAPTEKANEIASKFGLPPRYLQALLNLSERSSKPQKVGDFYDVPAGDGSIGQLRAASGKSRGGKLDRFFRNLREAQTLAWAAYERDGGRGQPSGKDLAAPNPLMGFVIGEVDTEGHLGRLIEALGECDFDVLAARAQAMRQKESNVHAATWIIEAAAKVHRDYPDLDARRFAELIDALTGGRKRTGAKAAWKLVCPSVRKGAAK